MQKWRKVILLLLLGIIALTGCSQNKLAANEIELKDMDGKTFKLSSQLGKNVYIKFWASWCPICMDGLSEFEQLNAEEHDFEIVSIVSPGHGREMNTADFRAWFNTLDQNNFRVLLDEGGTIAKKFGIRAYPTSFFISKEGTIKVYPGDIPNDMIAAIFASNVLEATPVGQATKVPE